MSETKILHQRAPLGFVRNVVLYGGCGTSAEALKIADIDTGCLYSRVDKIDIDAKEGVSLRRLVTDLEGKYVLGPVSGNLCHEHVKLNVVAMWVTPEGVEIPRDLDKAPHPIFAEVYRKMLELK